MSGHRSSAVAAAAKSFMILHDPEARVNQSTWTRELPLHRAVLDSALPSRAQQAVSLPRGGGGDRRHAYEVVYEQISAQMSADRVEDVLEQARLADSEGLLYLHVATRTPPALGASASSGRSRTRLRHGEVPDVSVIVPVRVAVPERSRNLDTCLRVLRTTHTDRVRVEVLLVEQDSEPRCSSTARDLSDQYVFAVNRGAFNKGWAVNIGFNRASAPVICVLDADCVLTGTALEWLVSALDHAGIAYPHTDMLCLDATSTEAVEALSRAEEITSDDLAPDRYSGYALRDTTGLCLAVRRSVFAEAAGFDERYRGWGDEDNDFVRRASEFGALVKTDGFGLHMHHPRGGESGVGNSRPNKRLVGVARPAEPGFLGDLALYQDEPRTVVPTSHIVFARHGESESNADGLFSTRPPGTGLSPQGREQARILAEGLQGQGIARILTSPLTRARETADVIAEHVQPPGGVIVEDRLMEIQAGELEGRPGGEAMSELDTAWQNWVKGRTDVLSAPGGETAEQVISRFRAVVERVHGEYPGETALIVAHGGILQLAVPAICDNLPLDHGYTNWLRNCETGWIKVQDGLMLCDIWQRTAVSTTSRHRAATRRKVSHR